MSQPNNKVVIEGDVVYIKEQLSQGCYDYGHGDVHTDDKKSLKHILFKEFSNGEKVRVTIEKL